MKSSDDHSLDTLNDAQQQLSAEPLEGRQRTVAEWTGDLLLGMRQPIQFRLADWP
ncbi:hypothetical protein [Pseudarthrobacter sp. NamE5]|uniref:hypothetical protein n=1 Tax=Pseudarthrobacter sp. NamE5 TaxID=2576839 RepID=UPI0014860ACB|nr:hypothetical protein [Pseudarthrobacter sp. NamE5]